ncbi:hypothetical protein BD410DRAFT_833639 [Rickenella mellea]|uniref:Uncharacterized protein n=1 Tax=Rickenella mellea TaxID=50990 RepID=A0A4R5XE85_9AGAM|nr:hypothetical protein BD410DRAFT_833639 [Rickenella mellea]
MSTNSRAHLLANLRTGGVRSANIQIPHTAAPSVSAFHIPDQAPMTAAVNGSFQQPYPQSQAQVQAQAQVFQMQMMQMEIMRLQALQQAQQAQQYQVELARQQQQQNFERRSSHANEPATAGPAINSFPRHRASQAELLKSQLHLSAKVGGDEVPQTAALGGKFGGRLNPHATSFRFGGSSEDLDVAASAQQQQQQQHGTVAPTNTPSTANFTTVISGGTPLGLSNGVTPTAMTSSGITPSKSDTAMNWRRGNNSVLNGNRAVSVNLKITPPAEDRISPPPVGSQTSTTTTKSRPVPLRFSVAVSQPLPAVAIDTSEGDASEETDDMSSSSSNKSDSSPTTPRTSSSSGSGSGAPPLTPREEASKRLYEGLGLGRPAPQSAQVLTQSFSVGGTVITVPHTSAGAMFPVNGRTFSQPMRQPRGPPSGADELGPKNFATRIRRKAIGGLGAMLDARVGRREVEAF